MPPCRRGAHRLPWTHPPSAARRRLLSRRCRGVLRRSARWNVTHNDSGTCTRKRGHVSGVAFEEERRARAHAEEEVQERHELAV